MIKLVDYDKLVERVPLHKDDISCTKGCLYYYLNDVNWTRPESTLCCSSKESGILPACDIGNNRAGVNPIVAYQASPLVPDLLECIYDRNLIDKVEQSDAAIQKFGPDNSLTRAFCQSKTFTCPTDVKDGCSRYFSTDKDGDYCRDLFNNYTPEQKDAAIQTYCLRNNTEDCKCVNRSTNFNYERLKQGNPFSDACWYIPCANKERFFVPSEFADNPSCPTNLCQIVYDISQAHDVDIERVKNDINCDFSGGGFKPTPFNASMYYIAMSLAIILLLVYASK
jgi:hypothetical protein